MAPWSPSRAGAPGPVTGREALARQGYAFHGAELYRAALSWLGDDASVQDAVQETIVRAWRAAERFDPARGSLRTWLYAILRNVVRDQYLARQRRPVPVDTQEHPEGGPRMSDRAMAPHRAQAPDPSDLVADTDLVTRALGQVSPDHRTAIVETFLRDRPYDDVAAELGVSVSTLRSQGPGHHRVRTRAGRRARAVWRRAVRWSAWFLPPCPTRCPDVPSCSASSPRP